MDLSCEIAAFVNNVQQLPEELLHILQHGSNAQFLDSISAAALYPNLTEHILSYFQPLAFDICARWAGKDIRRTSAAFGRILDVFPQLSELAQRLLIQVHDRLDDYQDIGDMDMLRESLLAIHRLMRFDNASYARFVRPAKLQVFLQHGDLSIRCLTLRILCQYLHASDAVLEGMKAKHLGTEVASAAWEDRTIDYTFLPLWEEKRLQDFRSRFSTAQISVSTSRVTGARIIGQGDLHASVADAGRVLLLRSSAAKASVPTMKGLVRTPTTLANLRKIAEALLEPNPILLTGLAGCGKTSLVKHTASILDKASSMITLHLNEQSDAKLLIGVYTTGAEPGSFQWQPGVLTTAVKEGRWVFIEDLDRAPNAIVSTLLPLIERGELLIPSRGEKLQAAAGFKIFATMRSTIDLIGQASTPGLHRLLGRRLWKHVPLGLQDAEELQGIVEQQHPVLIPYITRIMAVYFRLTSMGNTALGSMRTHQLRSRPTSSRELFKWTSRISAALGAAGVKSGSEAIAESTLDSIFLDAHDCFVSNLEDHDTRDLLATWIAEELHIDSRRRDHLLTSRQIKITRPTKSSSHTDSAYLRVGRALPITLKAHRSTSRPGSAVFSFNGHSLRLFEQMAVTISQREPLLLVGETGIGKTAAIQHLSTMVGQELVAINLSQQSESGDLLGGFKPINIRSIAVPLKDEFDALFGDALSRKKNAEFLARLSSSIDKGKWKLAISLWRAALQTVEKAARAAETEHAVSLSANGEQQAKRRKIDRSESAKTKAKCAAFAQKLDAFERQSSGPSNAFRFAFAEGNLVKAVRQGYWVLLDEINLASSDTLESLSDLLESGEDARPFIILTEAGSVERIEAHPSFRIFAAMNPASDVGKKDLPMGIRSRFTELYVESPDKDTKSLESIVHSYLERAIQTDKDKALPATVTAIYQDIQGVAIEEGLVDGSGQRPHFSLRTLTRTLSHAVATLDQSGLKRAVYEGFCMCFFTSLDPASEAKILQKVQSRLFGEPSSIKAYLKKPLRPPHNADGCVEVSLVVEPVEKGSQTREQKHWIPRGRDALQNSSRYIITPYVARNLRNLIRAASTRSHPVLIQGPTSAGKTSMVEYLAHRSGNRFVRINNHEHTDLHEYLGTYVSNANGQLMFQEGVLVQAVREGHWVVLDELNLAPTDVLEALNRLLDGNRELLIPETQEVIKPHSDFMLFATQNPAGPYGGRKALSRAFRNRFIELHFDNIPVDELNIILSRRSQLPESWCRLIVEVYSRLSRLRQEQRLFEQDSFATLRDLFRWAFRGADTLEELAATGYMLLAEKTRKVEERERVKDVIEQVMSRKGVKVQITEARLYAASNCPEMSKYDATNTGVIWTSSMRRLYTLVSHAIRHNEPVLLVGETGCGKTTICQMLALSLHQKLHTVNAHQNTETGDLIGSQRPIRNRAAIELELHQDLQLWHRSLSAPKVTAQSDIDQLLDAYDSQTQNQLSKVPSEMASRIVVNRTRRRALFEWVDGSLVQAMRSGQFYLLDEISLADDSVLERMNSVLDPDRSLLLAEKGSDDSLVLAADGFQFFATMNPGGDYGKKELSPALRNRFTEIWVPPLSDIVDILQIAEAKLMEDAKPYAPYMVDFAKWFGERFNPTKPMTISIRDILAWIDFINAAELHVVEAIVHGAAMVFLDTLGANPSALLATPSASIDEERRTSLSRLGQLLKVPAQEIYDRPITFHRDVSYLRCGPFNLQVLSNMDPRTDFDFNASTARQNALKIVRALQLQKPILLEGNPGVGKTSVVIAIAKAAGRQLVRTNLSEQTDLMDLFGSDVPVEGAEAGNFAWRDAPFLQAMKRGDWVLLDEMNLASQSVLEGLNACLDHRGEVYISELDQTFARHPDFKLFAAQNPHHQGGGRKGLPASFVNRFTVVYADMYQQADLELICSRLFPAHAHNELIKRAVAFVADLDKQVVIERSFGARGSPWEFNLRDILRWLALLTSRQGLLPAGNSASFFEIVFTQRFRSDRDIASARALFNVHFLGDHHIPNPSLHLAPSTLQIGFGVLPRSSLISRTLPPPGYQPGGRLQAMQSLMVCIQRNWPVILVGPSGVGKSITLQALASAVGAELETFALNADIDATDLVGGYEQADIARDYKAFVDDLIVYCFKHLTGQMSLAASHDASLTTLLFGILEEAQISPLEHEQCHKISSLLNQYVMQDDSEEASHLLARCDRLTHTSGIVEMAKFEWIDGVLVNALEQGRWLVLDNANLCSSSVLDRLNSLLEPGGSLVVSEHCNEDGAPKTVQPHANFRIFLTMDPQYGELSRAMRNRAVELYMPALQDEREPSLLRKSFTTESSLLTLRCLIDISNVATFSHDLTAQLVQLASESLSIADTHLLPRFATQVDAGLVATQAQATISTAIQRYQQATLLDSTYYSASSRHYTAVAKCIGVADDYAITQPMHPLANAHLVLYDKNTVLSPDMRRLGKLHDVFLQLIDMSSAINRFRVTSAPSHTMTRLARSLASDRLQNVSKDTTLHVGSFLLNTASAVLEWVKAERMPVDQSSISFETTSIFVGEFLRFWRDIFDLTNSTTFQEAIFQTYLSLGDALFSDLPVTKASPDELPATIKQQFDRISSSASRTTGFSMEIMWQVYRPTVPRNFVQLLGIQRLISLAKKFGGLMWSIRAPIDTIAAVQSSLQRACIAVVDQDAEPAALVHDIELAITSLQTRRHEDAHDMPFLQPVFAAFCRLRDLDHSRPSSVASRHDHLQLLASCTLTPIDLRSPMESSKMSLASLAGLERHDISMDGHPVMVDHAHLALLKKLDAIHDVNLKQLELLQTELSVMKRYVTAESAMICSKHPSNIMRLLSIQLVHLLGAHHVDIPSFSLPPSPTWQDTEALLVNILHLVQTAGLSRAIKERISHTITRIQRLCSDRNHGWSVSWSTAGKCMVEVAVLCLMLFVPDRPYDPALRSQVVWSLHMKHRESLQQRLEAFTKLQQLRSGISLDLRLLCCQEELQCLTAPPPSVEVARPPKSRLDELQVEFANVLRITYQVQHAIENNAWNSTGNAPELAILDTLNTMAGRLEERFPDYADIVTPAVKFLGCLRTGLALIRRGEVTDGQPTPDWGFDGSMGLKVLPLSGMSFSDLQRLTSSSFGESLVLGWLKLRSTVEPVASWSDETVSRLIQEFDRLHGRWQVQLERDQRADQTSKSLYHFKGDQTEDDETLEREFEKLFPSFAADEFEEQERHKHWNPRAAASMAASVHMAIFMKTEDQEATLESLMRKCASEISQHTLAPGLSVDQLPSNEITRPERTLPALFLTLKYRTNALQSQSALAKSYSIYTDTNVPEVKRFTTLIYSIDDRFRSIVETWPEHAALHTVLDICKELLKVGHAEPIMKLMPKAEQLHVGVTEWQSVASREFSVAGLLEELSKMIIKWRELELSTWGGLLDVEDLRTAEDAKGFWFLAYGSINAVDLTAHIPELLLTLQDMIRQSTLGQFAHRLMMLRSLSAQLDITSRNAGSSASAAASALVNFCDYFDRYQALIDETIAKGRAGLEKSVKEVAQLARWEGHNVEALKQSAKASHRKLFRIIKKYRELLDQPVLPILSRELPVPANFPHNDQAMHGAISIPDVEVIRKCQEHKLQWERRPNRFRDTQATATMIRRLAILDDMTAPTATRLDDFVDSLEASIAHLQKATPSDLTEDNATTIKHLTARKRRLFADTLKELRQMGLKSNPSVDLITSQNSLATILRSLPPLSDEHAAQKVYVESQSYLHLVIDSIDAVRRASTEHHEDLGANDAARSVGFLESLLATCLQQRAALSKFQASMTSLDHLISRSKAVWSNGSCQLRKESEWLPSSAASLEVKMKWLPTILRVGATVLTAQAELGGLHFNDLVVMLRGGAGQISDLQDARSRMIPSPDHLISNVYLSWIDQTTDALKQVDGNVCQYLEEKPHAKVVLDHLLYWIRCESESVNGVMANRVGMRSLAEFDSAYFNTLDALLGTIQDVERSLHVLKTDEDDKDWLIRSMRTEHDAFASFRVDHVISRLNTNLAQLSSVAKNASDDGLIAACASFAMALPILEQYQAGVKQALTRCAKLHRSTCRATWRLTKSFTQVAAQGFCKPAEPANEKGGTTEQLESGTGLGDGEGAEDISKDIGDDEDLSELAQDENNQKKVGDMDNQDDAVNIEDALEGAAGQDLEGEEVEQEKQEDKGDEDDADMQSETGSVGDGEGREAEEGKDSAGNEVGRVNDLSPSAVDEKMWDEAGDESKREKLGKDSSKSASADQDVGAEAESEEKKGEAEDGASKKDDASESEGNAPSDPELETNAEREVAMDSHVQEFEGLDLPEDMQLDGDKTKYNRLDDLDDEDHLDDLDDVESGAREDKKDELEPHFMNDEDDAEPVAGQNDSASNADEQETDEDDMQGLEQESRGQDALYGEQEQIDRQSELGAGTIDQATGDAAEVQLVSESLAQGAGPDDTNDEQLKSSTAAQRQSGAPSEPALTAPGSGPEGQAEPEPSSADNKDHQMIKKLGDVLEKWHRQHQEIQCSDPEQQREDQNGQQEDTDMTNAQFEHLPDEDAEADTQALGASTQEQARALDDRMDADKEGPADQEQLNQLPPDQLQQDEGASDGDADMTESTNPQNAENPEIEEQATREPRAFVGDRKDHPKSSEQSIPEDVAVRDRSEPPSPSINNEDLNAISLETRPTSPSDAVDTTALWQYYTSGTHTLSLTLTEQLRLILAPTLATKLRGDFRTGKRLNIKRIIPYIASSYKRDKIWMRRSVPSKRAYQVMLAIDDSGSMGETVNLPFGPHAASKSSNSKPSSRTQTTRADLAFSTLALLTTSFNALEVGDISVLGFGSEPFIAHDFNSPFTPSSGPSVLQQFTFQQRRTNVRKLLETAIAQFVEARTKQQGGEELWQLMLIVGDGICEDHEGIRQELVRAREEMILVVFIIVDQTGEQAGAVRGSAGKDGGMEQSILELETVDFIAQKRDDGSEREAKLVRKKYLDTFPFQYYLIVRDVRELPGVLATALRQWFAEVSER